MTNPALEKWLELMAPGKWSPRYVKWAFLACVSAALEKRCYMSGGLVGTIYPNLYVVLVGGAGAGKSTVCSRAVSFLLDPLENGPVRASNCLTPAALVEEFQRAYDEKRHLGYETSPLFVYASELGMFMQDIGGGDLVTSLIEFYDAMKPGEIWKKTLIKKKYEIMSPQLTMLAGTTRSWLQRNNLVDSAGVGFTGRTVFVHDPVFTPKSADFPALNEALLRDLQRTMKRVSTIQGEFILMNGGKLAYKAVVEKVNKWQSEHHGSDGVFAMYMSRKPINILKAAMCLSAVRGEDMLLKEEDILLAEALMEELEPDLLNAFGITIKFRDEGLMQKILNKLPLGDEVSQQKLFHLFRLEGQGVPTGWELEGAVGGLLALGAITVYTKGTMVTYKRLK